MTRDAKEARRAAVLATARHVLSTQGSDALHMKELAGLAGVPRASLYRAYASKHHVIRAVALAWGLDFGRRLSATRPRGRTRGARITALFRRLLKEAESDPKLIAAVLESLASTDVEGATVFRGIEALLPDLLRSVVDVDRMPDAPRVIEALLGLLFANLQWMTSGRASLDQALASLVFATERLVGESYWRGVPTAPT